MNPHARSDINTQGRSSSSRYRPANICAQCGEALYLPEYSEWLDAGYARHLWQCDACGYTFETTVHFAAA